jgi:hypothetical protein
VFTVLAPQNLGDARSGNLVLDRVSLSSESRVLRGKTVRLKTVHRSVGKHFDSVMTLYYDGDPRRGGELFDMQTIPRIPVNSSVSDVAYFQAKTCGRHSIFVRAIPLDGSAKPSTAETTIDVTIDPVASVNELIGYVRKLQVSVGLRDELLEHLERARHEYEEGDIAEGREQLNLFEEKVREHRRQISDTVEDAMTNHVRDILGCVRGDREHEGE